MAHRRWAQVPEGNWDDDETWAPKKRLVRLQRSTCGSVEHLPEERIGSNTLMASRSTKQRPIPFPGCLPRSHRRVRIAKLEIAIDSNDTSQQFSGCPSVAGHSDIHVNRGMIQHALSSAHRSEGGIDERWCYPPGSRVVWVVHGVLATQTELTEGECAPGVGRWRFELGEGWERKAHM
eukprot:scaffold174351_cov29-Tisochrysis_lutea.AAC.7